MRVISNTSPLLNLSIIDPLNLVREQFGEVHIPPAVEEEVGLDASRPGSQELRKEAGFWLSPSLREQVLRGRT